MNAPDDVYTHGHDESVLRSHRWRTAENSASYLLPRIDQASRILDVGCGPGTITVDLARIASQGHVVGIDRSEDVVSQAAQAVIDAGLPNVEVATGDVYALAYDDDSFDVVHAHQVLQHLSDPVAALREMARVCRPGGTIAVRDSDYAAFTWWPATPELDRWLELYRTIARGNGAEPDAGRRLKAWALEAGVEVQEASAGVWCFSDPDDVAWWGGLWADRVESSTLTEQALDRGLADHSELHRIADGWRRWAKTPDAWFAVLHGELLGTPAPRG